jgi:dipeptidyl aminopeptidase/acylaminoacyl peptidase
MMEADGSNPVKMVEDSYINVFPRWSSDGQSLMFTSRHAGIEAPRLLRRLSLSGTVPEQLPLELVESGWGDAGPDGRIVFRANSGQVQVFDPRDKKTQTLNSVRGSYFSWSGDGQHLASIVSARQLGDKEAGVWVYDSDGGAPLQLFRGWVANYAWAGGDELFVVEGKPDLSAVLWRARLEGSPPVRTRTALRLRFSLPELGAAAGTGYARFDVHPDRKRIVVEAYRFQEADISMIENIR